MKESLPDAVRWLSERDPERLAELFAWADRVRQEQVGDTVHLRGLIEISNICRRSCTYCGLRRQNLKLPRYRMTDDEVKAAAAVAAAAGCRTIVLQAGEDPGLRPSRVARLVEDLKRDLGVAVTLSLGEQPPAVLRLWREAGADRYLLKLETSDRGLFVSLHPGESPAAWERRLHTLGVLKGLGYQVGSGSILGVPGQTLSSVARDLAVFRELDLDMVACGPFVPHPDTPLGEAASLGLSVAPSRGPAAGPPPEPAPEEAEAALLREPLTGLVVVALSRIFCPEAHIPATTALRLLLGEEGFRPFECGADVLMPDFTPAKYASLYRIYPGKEEMAATAEQTLSEFISRLVAQGRRLATSPGDRRPGPVAA